MEDKMNQYETFKKFMFEKWLEFQVKEGGKTTLTRFANAISEHAASGEIIDKGRIHQGDVSHWLAGDRLPDDRKCKILAKSPLIGPGVWKAAGFEFDEHGVLKVTDPMEKQVLEAMRSMPRPMAEQYARMLHQEAEKARAKKQESAHQYVFQGS